MEVTLGELVDRLAIVNLKIWHLEDKIRDSKEKELGLEEVGRRALQIRDYNSERIAVKNAINEFAKQGFTEIKIDHASE